MKRFILALLIAAGTLHAQSLIVISGSKVSTPAATPTFSPAAGAVANPTTVTASSSSGCSGHIYFDTSNPPTTLQSTYSVTTAVTLYAQVRGCPGFGDSAVGSATYTISGGTLPVVIQAVNCSSFPCTITSTGAGDLLLYMSAVSTTNLGDITAVSANVSGALSRVASCNYAPSGAGGSLDTWALTSITGGDTSVSETSGHSPGGWIIEVSHANTLQNGGCLLVNNTSATATPAGVSSSISANQFVATSIFVNSAATDSINSGSLPSSSAWTFDWYAGDQTPVGHAAVSSSATYKLVVNNHSGNTSTSFSTMVVYGN